MEGQRIYRHCPEHHNSPCYNSTCEHQCFMEEKECRESDKPQSETTWEEMMRKFDSTPWKWGDAPKPHIQPVTIHIHNDFGPLLEVLLSINQKLQKMSEVNDQINATVDALSTSLDKIKADIATLAGEINPGGLTGAEATALQTKLNAIAGKAVEIDALTPDA